MLPRTRLMLCVYALCGCFQDVCNYPHSGDGAQDIVLVEEMLHYGAPAFNESAGTTLIAFEQLQQQQGLMLGQQCCSEPTDRIDNESEVYNEDDLIFPVRKPHQQQSDEVYQIDLLTSDEEDSLTSAASTSASAEHAGEVDGVPREIELRTDAAAARALKPIDMSDFVALIPAAQVEAIAANYYRNDAEVQRAYAFLRGRHFALLKRHIIELPEMAAFLKYLNSSGLDVVGFLHTLTNLTSKPQAPPAALNDNVGNERIGRVMPTATETTVRRNEIKKSQHVPLAKPTTSTTATTTTTNTNTTNAKAVNAKTTTSTTPLPPDITATTKEPLNGLHGLVDSILDVLPQDEVLTTFFDKLESDEQFAKLVDSIGTPLFAKILNDLEDTTQADVKSTLDILEEQFMERMHELHHALDSDLLACDAKWTLFVAAALSYRYDALLRPFPTRFASEQSGCNIDALVSVINDMPKLSVVLSCIAEQNYDQCDVEVLELLHWVLVGNRAPTLRTVDDDECIELLHAVGEKSKLERPTHVFEVCQAMSCHSDTFLTHSNNNETEVAYYGNKLDRFFSIINHGFVQNQCAANDYAGMPVVLKRHLADSLSQSPIGAGWGASSCGSMIACVAVCEYLNLPDGVECNEGNQVDIGGGGSWDAGRGDDNETNVVIENSDSVRIRYLLFYGCRFAEYVVPESDMFGWINRHKFSLSLAAYMLMLASIVAANSGSGQYIMHFPSKTATFVLDFCKRIFVNE